MRHAAEARRFGRGEFDPLEPGFVGVADHLHVDRDLAVRLRHREERRFRHAAETMKRVPDGVALALEEDLRGEPRREDEPLARLEELRVLLVVRALHHAASDDELVAVFVERAEPVGVPTGDGPLRMEEHERVAFALLRTVPAGLVETLRGLAVDGNAQPLEILDGAVRASTVDAVDLVELRSVDERHVVLDAVDFVPRDETQGNCHFLLLSAAFSALVGSPLFRPGNRTLQRAATTTTNINSIW